MDSEFTIVMRGYERHEVDEFIRELAAENDRLAERLRASESQLADARQSSTAPSTPEDGFRALGEETTRILVAAETAAREMREKAEQQAATQVAEAEREATERVETATDQAARIVAEAEGRRDTIEGEIARLGGVRDRLVRDLRQAIDTTAAAIGEASPAVPTAAPVAAAPAPAASPFAAATAIADELVVDEEVDRAPADDAAPAPAPAPEPAAEPEPAAAAEPATEPEPAPEPAPAPEPVREPAAEHGAAKEALEAALTEAAVAAGREPVAEPLERDGAPTVTRERSLAGVRPGMLRRLRRGLQEAQNGVLEAVRTRGDEDIESVLPGEDVAESISDVARVFLDAAYRAGRADAPMLAGGEGLEDPATDPERVADAAAALAAELLDELARTLTPSLTAGAAADEPDASLSERVGEVFRDLKGPVVETIVDRHLTTLYGQATLDEWRDAGVTRVTWVLGEETRCPEQMCAANAGEGPVDLGSAFPSGDVVPPAHEGCTCALAPA